MIIDNSVTGLSFFFLFLLACNFFLFQKFLHTCKKRDLTLHLHLLSFKVAIQGVMRLCDIMLCVCVEDIDRVVGPPARFTPFFKSIGKYVVLDSRASGT